MITINNSIFDVQGASAKDKVFGVTLAGAEDITIKDCTFKNKGYSAILNNCTGNVYIEDCTFDCETMYNPIEGAQDVSNGNVSVKGCTFNNHGGNNFINFYNVKEGSSHIIENCTFAPSVDTNILRLSNRTNATASFTVRDCSYQFQEGDAHAYTAFMICQDYTKKTGVTQNFNTYQVKLHNLKCNGQKITALDNAAKGAVYYVYQDGAGVITGQNDPVVTID